MRQIIKVLMAIAILFQVILFGNFIKAQDSSGMYIDNFESEISILADSWLQIDEKISVMFETDRHGIYRTIPYRYHDKYGNTRNIKIDQISVTNESHVQIPYQRSNSLGKISLKIGDPDKLVIGSKQYNISYKVWGAINYFDGEAEFYWNATGNDWAMPIEKSTASILISPDQCLRVIGFEGRLGSNTTAEVNKCSVSSDRVLKNNQNLTIVARWPKELTPPPTTTQRFSNFILWNWIYFVPLLTLIIALLLFLKCGRDPSGRGTIAPCFEPPRKMTPIEIGALADNKAQGRDFSAMIIDFAIRGYISIKETPKKGILSNIDYELVKKKDPDNLKSFERIVFEGLFSAGSSVKLSSLKNSFYKTKKQTEKDLFNQLVSQNFYPTSPLTAGSINYTVGIILIVLGFSFSGIFTRYGISVFSAVFCLVLSGIIVIVFGLFMSKRTKEGAIVHEEILGFKLYLETAEKYRMEFYEKEKYFEKYLPYAMALGVAKIWAAKFKNIYQEGNQPDWYSGHSFATFNAIYFVSTIDSDFSSNVNSAFASTPFSGGSSGFGGGFSGGGFGGGGGRGW